MRGIVGLLGAGAVGALVLLAAVAPAQEKKEAKTEKIALDKVPEKILTAVMGRFPGAKLRSVEKEIENGQVVYDVELTHKGRKHEMDIKADGTVIEVENEVAAKDLPAAVTRALQAKYPRATFKEIMAVYKVNGTDEKLVDYEITLVTAAGRSLEVTVSPDGKRVKGGQAEGAKKE
jgi:hypothetical protein